MRSLILCEGFDDVLVLGYYLHKTQGWNFEPKGSFSKLYKFPKLDAKRQVVEIYKKDDDFVGIWAVGGKDTFDKAFRFVSDINNQNPEQGIDKVFVVTDRDDGEIESCVENLRMKLNACGLAVQSLRNMEKNSYFYEIDEEVYVLEIIPLIIPFDKTGALETVLIDGIAETGSEESYITERAGQYIDEVLASGHLQHYLQHERLILKAKLSAVISVTNPDRSTGLFDKVLMSWNWEEKEAVKRHFEPIIRCLKGDCKSVEKVL